MEVIASRDRARDIRELANALLSLEGVKHEKLFLTLPAREIVARRKVEHYHSHYKPTPSRRRVGRHGAKNYWQMAVHLMESARALIALGDAECGNAIGICSIHAVISANDAVTISSRKSAHCNAGG